MNAKTLCKIIVRKSRLHSSQAGPPARIETAEDLFAGAIEESKVGSRRCDVTNRHGRCRPPVRVRLQKASALPCLPIVTHSPEINHTRISPSPNTSPHPQWRPYHVSYAHICSSTAFAGGRCVAHAIAACLANSASQQSPIADFHHQTSLPSSPLPSLSARPSTTPSLSPSSDPSSVTHTAARSRPTPRRSTSTARRPLPLPPHGVAPLSALPSRHTVSVLSSTPPVPSPTRAPPTSAL